MKHEKRAEALMPDGIPKYIRVYDNGGIGAVSFHRPTLQFFEEGDKIPHDMKVIKVSKGTIDRFTVVFTGNFPGRDHRCYYLGMSGRPFHPQGIGTLADSSTIVDLAMKSCWPPKIGGQCHLGRRVTYHQLTPEAAKLVRMTYRQLWNLPKTQQGKLEPLDTYALKVSKKCRKLINK